MTTLDFPNNPISGDTYLGWTFDGEKWNANVTALGSMSNQNANDVAITGGTINGVAISVATPTQPNDAVNKAYVDNVAENLHIHEAVNCATTAALTATYNNGALGVGATLTLSGSLSTIDGFALSNGNRILVKDQANQAHNGIYVRTSATVLTRASDFDTALEIAGGDFIFVESGTTYASSGWVQTFEVNTVGTDTVIWRQFSGSGTFSAGNGLTLTGSTFDVVGTANRITANIDSIDIASTYVGQTSITTLGTIGTGTWQGSTVGVLYGGTGTTTSTGTGSVVLSASPTITGTLSAATITASSDATINSLRVGLGAGSITSNLAVGFETLNANSTGNTNVAIGYQALKVNTSGAGNVAIGVSSLQNSTTGSNNVAIGTSALNTGTTFSNNTAIGHEALKANTANNNVAIGYQALLSNIVGTQNTAIGYQALSTNTGGFNTALGYQTLNSSRAGVGNTNNIAIGRANLTVIGSGINSVYLYDGGYDYVDGVWDVYVEWASGPVPNVIQQAIVTLYIDGGSVYDAVLLNPGYGYTSVDTVLTVNDPYGDTIGPGNGGLLIGIGDLRYATNNIAVGNNSGNTLYTGSNNIILGNNSGVSTSNSNSIVIGNNIYTQSSNSVIIGDSSITSTVLYGTVTMPRLNVNSTGADITGPLNLYGSATSNANFNTSQTSGVITIGGTSSSTSAGTITLGRASGTSTVNIGIGIPAASRTKTINIGTSDTTPAGTTLINIGANALTTTTIRGPSVTLAALGTSTNFSVPYPSPALWLQLSKYVGNVTYTGGFRMQAIWDTTNTETLLFDTPDTATDRTTVIKYNFKNTQMQVMNTNDAMGFEFMATYGTAYLGIFNSGGATGVFPANGYRNLFAMQRSDAAVGACTPNNGGSPVFTNKLDDGAGNLIVGGNASTINSSRYLAVNHTTAANSTTSGALRVAGGAGIVGALYVGTDSVINAVWVGRSAGNQQANTRLGEGTLTSNVSGGDNTAVGYAALTMNQSGNSNTAVGRLALRENLTGGSNVAIGRDAIRRNTSGSSNVAVGNATLTASLTSSGNVAVGESALTAFNNSPSTNGSNVAIGFNALNALTTGVNNIAIGASTNAQASTDTNTIIIGTSATGIGSNTTVIGNSSITQAKIFGQVAVGGNTPASATAAGVAGTITWDANYIYVCVATNTWKRTPITAW